MRESFESHKFSYYICQHMEARIYLERMSDQDFEFFYSLSGNEQVMKMITGRPQTREEARKKFDSLQENNKWRDTLGSFIVIERKSSEQIGFAKLEITGENPHEAELGYVLLPKFWGRGYGGEIAEQLMGVAEADPGLTRIYAYVDPSNIASRKILLRLGFISESIGEIDGLPTEVFGMMMR